MNRINVSPMPKGTSIAKYQISIFYVLGLFATIALLLLSPDDAFQVDKMTAAVIVLVYSVFFYLFAEKEFIASIPSSKNLVLVSVAGLLLCAMLLQTILMGPFSLSFALKLFIGMIGPVCVVFFTENNPGKFHRLDFLAFLLIFIPVEARFVSLPLMYQKDILKFDTVFTSMTILVFWLFLNYRKIDVGFTWRSSLRAWMETAGFTILLILLACMLGFSKGWLSFAGGEFDGRKAIIVALFMFFHGSLIEEFFFRGLIFNYFMQINKKYGFLINILINTGIFGATHYNNGGIPVVVLSSLAGFFFCVVYYRTGNIFCSTFIHAAINTVWRTMFL